MSQTNVVAFRPRQQAEPQREQGWPITRLKQCFRESEEACQETRRLAFRDGDYYHNFDDDHWTKYEKAKLKERRQQIATSNRIKGKVNATLFYVENARSDPKAYATREGQEAGAEIAEEALDYIERTSLFDEVDADCAFDACWSGLNICEVTLDEETNEITAEKICYDRFFYDPRSQKMDFSDARWLGYHEWMDDEVAKSRYSDPEAQRLIESSFDGLYSSDEGYEDKPYGIYAQKERNRVRVVVIYYRLGSGEWMVAHFTGAGILYEDLSPWPGKRGNAAAIIVNAVYRDREGRPYGPIRDWISPQNELNQRKSRSLHLLADRRTWGVGGWTEDEDRAKEALARPDGHIRVNGPLGTTWGLIDSTAEVQGNFELLQQAIADIELGGQYISGDRQRASDQSGVALERLQMAGLAQDAPFFRARKAFKLAVYRRFWFMAKKFWQGPKALPILTEDGPVQFLKINQPVGIDPVSGQPIVQNPISQIDVDFIIDTGPEMITLPQQDYEMIKEIAQVLVNYPPQVAMVLVEASPLKSSRKQAILSMIQQSQQAPPPDPLAVATVQADVRLKGAQTVKTIAEAEKIGAEIDAVDAGIDETRVNTARAFAEGMVGPEPKEPKR